MVPKTATRAQPSALFNVRCESEPNISTWTARMRLACLWLLAFASWPGPLSWSFFVKSWSRSSRVQVRLSATSSDNIKSKSLWSGRKNLNEVFFKEELQRLEQEVAEAEAREKKEASSKLGTAETTTRRVPIPSSTVPVKEVEAAVAVEEEESPEATASTNSSATSASATRLPFLDVESIGLTGRWVERSGNFILRPSPTREQPPLGVIHFLGGAFVGAAPHLTYRYLLESLADAGYVVVATPYRLDFDYLRSCDTILSKFDAVAVELATEYGPLPVIGLGHSCGALLQVLVTSLFPDAPRAANVLVSFNNRPASQSIPGLEEVIAPLSGMLLSPTPPPAPISVSIPRLAGTGTGFAGFGRGGVSGARGRGKVPRLVRAVRPCPVLCGQGGAAPASSEHGNCRPDSAFTEGCRLWRA